MAKLNLRDLHPILKLTFVIYSCAFIYFFVQNFVFSSNFDLLSFRGVDDAAFQQFIRDSHKSITNFAISSSPPETTFLRLGVLYGYGYGWLFWFPMVMLTYPLYWLEQLIGWQLPLIVVPRQISLFFTFATAIVVYRIISLYTKDSYIKAFALLTLLSFPSFGYFAMRFGTVGQTMFLCALSVYLAARIQQPNKAELKWLAITFACAVATKFSSLLVGPLIFLLLADRHSWHINKESMLNALFFLKWLVPCTIILANPSMIFAPFDSRIIPNYISVLSQYTGLAQSQIGLEFDMISNYTNGIVANSLSIPAFIFLLSGMFIAALQHKHKDLLYMLITLILISIYLSFSIKLGPSYVSNYFTTLSYLLVLGYVVLSGLQSTKIKALICTAIFLGNYALNYQNIWGKNIFAHNTYFAKQNSHSIKQKLVVQDELRQLVAKPKEGENLYLLRDYKAPEIYSELNDGVYQATIFSNIGVVMQYYDQPYGIIGFYKDGIAFYDDEKFAEHIANTDPDTGEKHQQHRSLVLAFLKQQKLQEHSYEKIYENGDYVYFKRIDTSSL